ncbi:serine acetyltransferase [Betaproteobacteria bacterium]|nr:serine acetyltransferase [Betaproteobacteria bacterium]GHU14538.1 serine acetyltransferase [Betaproteobacteria bacterium]
MFEHLREDIASVLERDPAARSRWEVLTCYPGVHALCLHRLAHAAWRHGWCVLGRFISACGRFLTGIEIHPAAVIGRRVFIDHGMGVVIGETAVVGDECTIYQGVTLGGTSLYRNTKRHPTLGKGVVVGAGAQVLGGLEVGDGARIGSNAVVIRPVGAGQTAVGNPAHIVGTGRGSGQGDEGADVRSEFAAYGVTCDANDPLAQALHALLDHAVDTDRRLQQVVNRLEAAGIKFDSAVAAEDDFNASELSRMMD